MQLETAHRASDRPTKGFSHYRPQINWINWSIWVFLTMLFRGLSHICQIGLS